MDDLQNKKWARDELEQVRQEVMTQWPTGKDVNLEEAFSYHRALPAHKVFSHKLNKAHQEGKTLIQPRAGVPLIAEMIELLTFLQDTGEADLLPTTIDSYTRQNRYQEAEVGITESARTQKAMLNGFPAVNHGVAGCRQLIDALDTPLQIRHGTPDARLLTEIAYAGGYTSYEGGGISYNIPYAKNVSLETTIRDWQYVDRLTGLYEEAGCPINREPYGPLTGTLVPPFISHSVAIIESLLAAEQGVKNITVGYGQCGNLVQDVAAVQVLQSLTEEYLRKYGYGDVHVTTVLHQWMGGFPQKEAQAYAVISWGSAVAALSHATKVIVKTPHEAVGVPTKEANADGMLCTRQMINMLGEQSLNTYSLKDEKVIIASETRCVLDRCFELGEGDIAKGAIHAIRSGVLDIPFAPSRYNAGKMLPARDNDGAIRLFHIGNIPLTPELIDFHREKMEERAKYENRKASFQMVIDDVYAISKGRLVGRPK
ncbi:MAG: methylaspartate mutase subunit E [Clostridiales bacterium]|jgi:methylaspartate mutase epsilon subunit|nr:methylaspartate mutase subunit E [Clostridiales bacterium]MCK9350394.1 methylaspartate mutase subunit E [Clostridiales bacterium]MDD3540964.1 methylaspartate mutase subunit E [Eubacteriales bacterium]NLG30423.1 methylaspartate mutase subunit E [Clostridiaceae bacterium]